MPKKFYEIDPSGWEVSVSLDGPGNTKERSITVPLTSYLTGLESAV